MANRRTNRKLVIRLRGREPDDPLRFLLAVDAAFRPGDIEISCEPAREEVSPRLEPLPVDEKLETRVRKNVGRVLDIRAEVAERISTLPATSEEWRRQWLRKRAERRSKESAIRSWSFRAAQRGWKVSVSLLTATKLVKEVFFK